MLWLVTSWLALSPAWAVCPQGQTPSVPMRRCLSEALAFEVTACARDAWAPACAKLARQDPAGTQAWMRRGCAREMSGACAFLGYMQLKGLGQARDLAAARASMGRACTLGGARACEALGGLLMTGKLGRKAPEDALTALTRGCALGRAPTCFIAGKYLELGQEVPKDLPHARRLHTRGCELGYKPSCARGASPERGASD